MPHAALGSPSVLLGVTLLTGGQPQRGGQSRQRNACLAGFDGGRVHHDNGTLEMVNALYREGFNDLAPDPRRGRR